jgi:hypothetical protein
LIDVAVAVVLRLVDLTVGLEVAMVLSLEMELACYMILATPG